MSLRFVSGVFLDYLIFTCPGYDAILAFDEQKIEIIHSSNWNKPSGIVALNKYELLICDTGNHCIKKLNLATNKVEIFAGGCHINGYIDDTLLNSRFYYPTCICIYNNKNNNNKNNINNNNNNIYNNNIYNNIYNNNNIIYIADTGNHCIRCIIDEKVKTIGGKGGNSGFIDGFDNKLYKPMGISIKYNNIYIADTGNHSIRYLSIYNSYKCYTISGASPGYVDGCVNKAAFNKPINIYFTKSKNLLIFDSKNNAIRIISKNFKFVKTVLDNTGIWPKISKKNEKISNIPLHPWGLISINQRLIEKLINYPPIEMCYDMWNETAKNYKTVETAETVEKYGPIDRPPRRCLVGAGRRSVTDNYQLHIDIKNHKNGDSFEFYNESIQWTPPPRRETPPSIETPPRRETPLGEDNFYLDLLEDIPKPSKPPMPTRLTSPRFRTPSRGLPVMSPLLSFIKYDKKEEKNNKKYYFEEKNDKLSASCPPFREEKESFFIDEFYLIDILGIESIYSNITLPKIWEMTLKSPKEVTFHRII
eukprot:GHVL01035226.1.p1 GENE.GHVL01035226.1~~GHVL01035226.1.p1  ORF type:complete len:533 (-),score=193.73 GHVL01035226.1:74-1672(-)